MVAGGLLVVSIVMLAGCGQKGALFIPGPDGKPLRPATTTAASGPSTPAAATAASAPSNSPDAPNPVSPRPAP